MKNLTAASTGEAIKFIVEGIVQYGDIKNVCDDVYFIDNVIDFVKHVINDPDLKEINLITIVYYATRFWFDKKVIKLTEPHTGFLDGNWTDENGNHFKPTKAN